MNIGQIKQAYTEKGLAVDRITRTRLNDGWFVYHEHGARHKAYKKPTIIEQTEHSITRKINRYQISCDWIEDNNEMMLRISIQEALHRKGK